MLIETLEQGKKYVQSELQTFVNFEQVNAGWANEVFCKMARVPITSISLYELIIFKRSKLLLQEVISCELFYTSSRKT